MRNMLRLATLFILLQGCDGKTVISSRDLPEKSRVPVLAKHIRYKSEVMKADYILYDANMDSFSVPGASGRDYRIVLRVSPAHAGRWIEGREKFINSYPRDMTFIRGILPPAEESHIMRRPYVILYEASASGGYEYTVWVDKSEGIVIIRYIQN